MKHWQTDFLDGRRGGALQIGGAETPPILFLVLFRVDYWVLLGLEIENMLNLIFASFAVNHHE